MTLFDWLSSPIGSDLVHALIVLLLAAAGYLTWRTHSVTQDNSEKLDQHIEEHAMQSQDVVSGDK